MSKGTRPGEIALPFDPALARPDAGLVFIGRRDVLAVAFPELLDDIERALAAARAAKAPSQRDPAPPGSIASPGVTRP